MIDIHAMPAWVHNPLRVKGFHEILAENVQDDSLKSRIGKVSILDQQQYSTHNPRYMVS